MTIISSMVPEIPSTTEKIFCHFGPFFTLTPITHPKNQNFLKKKKAPRDIIISHMCTINDSHMIYGFWDMECNGQNFLLFWTDFCPFILLTTPKIKILKIMEKLPGDIIILHRCDINDNHMMYGCGDMKHDGQIFCHFGQFFSLLPR